MMKNRNRLMALALAATMLMSLVGCGNTEDTKTSSGAGSSTKTEASAAEEATTVEDSDKIEWLNYDSPLPVVKEGYDKTLSIYCLQNEHFGAPEESWMYRYLTNETNINLEITPFTASNRSEFISLAFASDELPDVIIGGAFGASSLLKYGLEEEQIIDIAPYITEEYMPNLYALYEEHPEYRTVVTDSEGHVWSLGYISNLEARGSLRHAFINYDWMEELGYSAPTTLDEFLDLMRAFKEAGYCEYPIGGAWAGETPYFYILNAMGYVGDVGSGFSVCLRNGEVVLPIYDREVFGDFLKIMNQIYTEGLVHPDFYTMDYSTISAIISQGVGFIGRAPKVYTADYTSYWGAIPLTSEWNDTPTWYSSSSALTCGGVVITSACEEPELAVRLLDMFYNMDNYESGYRLAVHGPNSTKTDILYGLEGWELVDGKFVYHDYENNTDKYENSSMFLTQEVQLWQVSSFGADPWHFNKYEGAYWGEQDYQNLGWSQEQLAALRHTDEAIMASGDKCFGVGIQSTAGQYVTAEVFPTIVYFSSDIAERNTEIQTAVNEYASQEIAKFVTGTRALTDDELNNYFDTLESLGIEEYLQNYRDYYEASQAN